MVFQPRRLLLIVTAVGTSNPTQFSYYTYKTFLQQWTWRQRQFLVLWGLTALSTGSSSVLHRILLQRLLLLVPHTISYIGHFSYRIGRILSCTVHNLSLVIYVSETCTCVKGGNELFSNLSRRLSCRSLSIHHASSYHLTLYNLCICNNSITILTNQVVQAM